MNLLQAYFTEINPDEAYYFLYGQQLSWGFFDHPPMVALLVHISSWLFKGNLGVRFMTVLLQIPALVLIWQQLDNKNYDKSRVLSFFIICTSSVMFCIYGFTSTPDAPLLFFTCLFLYSYKLFLEKSDWRHTFLISIAITGLIYSKYHGVLLIAFVIFSNLHILANSKFWVSVLLALVLCSPHLYWQYVNGLPSLKYHLVERSDSFAWWYLTEYLLNLLVTFNPFTIGAVAYIMIKYKPVQKFERALYSTIIGFIFFFLLATVHGHVQPQWTVAASVPMIILLNNKILIDRKLRGFVKKFVGASLVLVVAARAVLISGLLPERFELSGKEPRYLAIEKIAKDKPVVFCGSYEDASLYTFFTGKPATAISSLKSRQTQFDLWHPEQYWNNKTVLIVDPDASTSKCFAATVNGYKINCLFTDSLQATNALKIFFQTDKDSVKKGDTLCVNFTIENTAACEINFKDSKFPVEIIAVMKKDPSGFFEIKGALAQAITVLNSKTKIDDSMRFVIPPLANGDYQFGLSCSSLFGPSINSNFKKITLLH
jgi:hypothetical protein